VTGELKGKKFMDTSTSDAGLHEATLMNLVHGHGFAYLHECREMIRYLNALE
jgi:hypothetical protein